MAVLATVNDYAATARVLLQDTVIPYRYVDTDIALGLSLAMGDARRLRPDLFIGVTTLPFFSVVDSTAVTMDDQYRNALLFYICGFVQLRDDENTEDSRSSAFYQAFNSMLTVGMEGLSIK